MSDEKNLGLAFNRRYYRYHFFISYHSNNLDIATNLAHSLQELGFRIWLDSDKGHHAQDIRPSDDVRGQPISGTEPAIREILQENIEQTLIVLVLTSEHVIKSVWVRTEILIARNRQIPIFFIHLSDLQYQDNTYPLMALEFINEFFQGYETTFIGQVNLNSLNPSYSHISNHLNQLVELSELIIEKRESITIITIEKYLPEFESLFSQVNELNKQIFDNFGIRIPGYRKPQESYYFRIKKPMIKQRITFLKQILEDESFRKNYF